RLFFISLVFFCVLGMSFSNASSIRASLDYQNDQTRAVSGKITDAAGQPLPGVNVLIKGTSQGTITDLDGEFSIELSTTAQPVILVFSFIGYETVETSVGNENYLEITLTQDTQTLEELVVVGYGTQKKANLT